MELTSEDDRYLKSLGKRIRQLRLDKGWSLEKTEEFGWPAWRHLQHIEMGKNITVITLRRVAKLFSVSPAELLKGL